MCTPRLRWIPEHCMQMKMPKFTLAHLGPLYVGDILISYYEEHRNMKVKRTL